MGSLHWRLLWDGVVSNEVDSWHHKVEKGTKYRGIPSNPKTTAKVVQSEVAISMGNEGKMWLSEMRRLRRLIEMSSQRLGI